MPPPQHTAAAATTRQRQPIAPPPPPTAPPSLHPVLRFATGGFSNWVLSNWPACTKYYMVDLWSAQDNYRQMDNATTSKNLERMEEARRNVARFGTKAVLVRKSSVEAAAQFEDASIDFVYLDARHTYDAVMEDLEAWWPKVRPGGIVAGEDYMDAEEVWRMTATCDWEGIGGGGFPWVGCDKWTLPYGQVSECSE